jgi:polar amino acid transport system ATP-binding protein
MLEIKNLHKNFGDKDVLKGINIQIKDGEIIGIIGPSGCGKSTLLRSINLLEVPTSGQVILDGDDLVDNNDLTVLRRKVGMVFQQFNLFENMNVLNNIIFAPVKLGVLNEKEALKKARAYLKKIDLADKEKAFPNELSGGQKQRVAIIRTLMMNPEIILFDEPTSALDPEMIGEVTHLMREIKKDNITMIIVSHEMNFIKNFCTRVLYMEDGMILEDGKSIDIFEKPQHKELINFLSKIKNI